MLQENGAPKRDYRKPWQKKYIIIFIPILLILILVGITTRILVNKKSNKNTQATVKPIKYEETITPNAYGNFLSVAVKSFYQGGNTNNVEIPAHNYYPSAADIKNRDWTKQNMQLDDRMSDLIKSGEVVYETKGCKSDKPSNEQNKCTSFVVKSAGVVLFDSTKKD